MPLTIARPDADQLARRLAELTGASVEQAVTEALRQRVAEEEAPRRAAFAGEADRIEAAAAALRPHYDRRPVMKEEMDELWGETD